MYYYGARYYDPKVSLWLNVDPLVEKTLTPYAYVNNNPIMLVDPTGMEPIGPPKTIFINGYLMGGSLKGGKEYWNKSFIEGALDFGSKTFHDRLKMKPIFVNYDPYWNSSVRDRVKQGYEYAIQNYSYLIKDMNQKEDYFNIIDHSMGSAFGEGVSKYMQEMGWEINKIVHINGFQAADIESCISKKKNIFEPPYVIDYQNTNDPVINNPIRSSPGDIKNSTYKIREKSNMDIDYIHASPISNGKYFWKELSKKMNNEQ